MMEICPCFSHIFCKVVYHQYNVILLLCSLDGEVHFCTNYFAQYYVSQYIKNLTSMSTYMNFSHHEGLCCNQNVWESEYRIDYKYTPSSVMYWSLWCHTYDAYILKRLLFNRKVWVGHICLFVCSYTKPLQLIKQFLFTSAALPMYVIISSSFSIVIIYDYVSQLQNIILFILCMCVHWY